jgi:hypothetical protein
VHGEELVVRLGLDQVPLRCEQFQPEEACQALMEIRYRIAIRLWSVVRSQDRTLYSQFR